MPKPERGTPKDIANRIKSKGLQKLKYYCQMCRKQCRDENGLKCHMTSQSHLRQMKLFVDNPHVIMDSFSKEFEMVYLDVLHRRHGTKRMNGNVVYQEVIADKHHVHMNGTIWATLGDFIQYLGKVGKCVVEETERGWYVTYIERDPALLAQREATERRAAMELREEERMSKERERMRREAARALDEGVDSTGVLLSRPSNMERRDGQDAAPVAIKLGVAVVASKATRTVAAAQGALKRSILDDDEDEIDGDDDDDDGTQKQHAHSERLGKLNTNDAEGRDAPDKTKTRQRKRSRWDKAPPDSNNDNNNNNDVTNRNGISLASSFIDTNYEKISIEAEYKNSKQMSKENSSSCSSTKQIGDDDNNDNNTKNKKKKTKKKKESRHHDNYTHRKDYWLHTNIIVKILSKNLANGLYYKHRGIVTKVVDRYVAQVEIIPSSSSSSNNNKHKFDYKNGNDVTSDDNNKNVVIIKIDQDDLETVIPTKIGTQVRIVNGKGRGRTAELLKLHIDRYCADLRLLNDKNEDDVNADCSTNSSCKDYKDEDCRDSSKQQRKNKKCQKENEDGLLIQNVDYEDFSKIASHV